MSLLPTPSAGNFNDGEELESWLARRERNKAKRINGNGQGMPLAIAVALLPTVTAGDARGSRNSTATRRAPKATTNTMSNTLSDLAWRGDLNDPRWIATDGTDYGPAIRRWEAITGHPAPESTEPGTRGNRRLSPAFAEWMMGLPAGHVTAVPGIPRSAQLHAIGNGVVPQQAVAAYTALLTLAAPPPDDGALFDLDALTQPLLATEAAA